MRYENVPRERAREAMISRGMPEWFAGAMVEVMQHTRTGAAANATRTVSEITGRPPRPYEEFAREHGATFLGG